MRHRVARWTSVACLVIAGQAAGADVTADPARLTALVDHTFAHYDLPGIAVGVIVDGEVVLRHTRGELRAGLGEVVDADTLFKIASNTKAMTAAVLARQVDAGLLRWDDPVVRHLPDFRMFDAWVTREIQVRDLLIHNSGLGPGAGDLMLWPSPNRFTRAQVIHGLRYLRPRWSFRSRYAYDNTLYIVAGEVAASIAGVPFGVLLEREVFEPLGMARCRAGTWQRDVVGNVAQPHARVEGRNVVVRADAPTIPDEPMMAAGGVRCSLDDMLRWAQAWLDVDTTLDGRPWLSPAQREAAWTAHMPMPLTPVMRDRDRSHFSAYGYGWRLTDIDGTSKVSHTGTLKGMYSALTLLPEWGIGIVVMINGDAADARTQLMQALLEQFTAPSGERDVARYVAQLDAMRAVRGNEAGGTTRGHARVPTTQQFAPVTGRWRDPWFGDIVICTTGGVPTFASTRSPRLHGDVVDVEGGLQVRWREPDVDVDAWLRPPGAGGDGALLRMEKVDPDADFSYDFEDLAFSRIGDCE